MEYGYSGVYDNSKVSMIMKGINTNYIDTCKAAILARPEMQGDFDIAARNFLDFISMTPYLQKNVTDKLSYVTRNGGEEGGGRGIDHISDMPGEYNVQAAMSAIKKNTSVYLNGAMSPRRSTRR